MTLLNQNGVRVTQNCRNRIEQCSKHRLPLSSGPVHVCSPQMFNKASLSLAFHLVGNMRMQNFVLHHLVGLIHAGGAAGGLGYIPQRQIHIVPCPKLFIMLTLLTIFSKTQLHFFFFFKCVSLKVSNCLTNFSLHYRFELKREWLRFHGNDRQPKADSSDSGLVGYERWSGLFSSADHTQQDLKIRVRLWLSGNLLTSLWSDFHLATLIKRFITSKLLGGSFRNKELLCC